MSIENFEDFDPIVRLRSLRDDWSDEVPEEILRGGKGNDSPKFKVRRNWWQGVFSCLHIASQKGILDDVLKEEIKNFMKEYGERIRNNLTTQEDIAAANVIITKVLDSVK